MRPRENHRRRSTWPALVSGSLLLLLQLLGTRVAPAQEAAPPRPRLGEAYIWNVRFAGLFDAGRARLAISPPRQIGAQSQINVIGEVEATGLVRALLGIHADYRVILDGKTLVTRRMDIEETGYRTVSLGVVVDGKNIAQYAKKPGAEIRVNGTLPSEPLEPVAVIMMLRVARLLNGDKLELIAMDGTDLYRGTIEVVGREELRSAMGTQQAIRLLCRGERVNHFGQKLPGRPPRQATLWVSDDNYHLPLRVEAQTAYGTGSFELTSFEPGRRPLPMPQQLTGITQRAAPPPPAQPPAQPIPPPPSSN